MIGGKDGLRATVRGPVLPSRWRRRSPSTSRHCRRTISFLRQPVSSSSRMMSACGRRPARSLRGAVEDPVQPGDLLRRQEPRRPRARVRPDPGCRVDGNVAALRPHGSGSHAAPPTYRVRPAGRRSAVGVEPPFDTCPPDPAPGQANRRPAEAACPMRRPRCAASPASA